MKKTLAISIIITVLTFVGCNNTDVSMTTSYSSSDSQKIEESASNIDRQSSNSTSNITSDEAKKATTNETTNNSEKRIICWGHSMVVGSGGGGVTMPNVLERLSGATVLNYGGYAENTNEVAARSGVNELTLTAKLPIDSSNEVSNSIEFESEWGKTDILLKYTDAGLNPVTIDGVIGVLTRCEPDDEPVTYYFRRLEPGEPKDAAPGTRIIPYYETDKREDDILVIWTGGNDTINSLDDIEILLNQIDELIEFSGSDKYIVISETTLHENFPFTDDVSNSYADHYGEHFLHLRKYLIEDAFSDLKIAPSEEDIADINCSDIPRYFRDDDVHGNALYYYLAGQQVYKKCQELGYLE